jgi:SP family myo-inositol transporter-like MFS transporter 13
VWIDTIGRRKILIWSMWGMPLGLILASIGFYYLPKSASGEILTGAPIGWSAVLVLVSLLLFIAAYATGLGNVPWQSTEFFPNELRGLGTTLLTVFNWGPNIAVSSTFLSMMHALTPSGAFLVYAAICLIGWIGVIFCFPECAGLSLEEIRLVFQDGFGIEKADELRRDKGE